METILPGVIVDPGRTTKTVSAAFCGERLFTLKQNYKITILFSAVADKR